MSDFNIESKAEKLCDIIMKKDEFWETKNKATLLLIDLVLPYENQPDDVLEQVFTAGFFRLLKEPVKAMICDLRSQQVRDICSLLSVISQICGDKMKGFLRDCFNNILDGIKVQNKVMSGYVDESIMLMIRNVTFKSAIPLIVTEVKDNKAKYVRERCLDYVNEILINWEVTEREADNLCEAIRSGLEDAAVKGREIARSAYMNMFQRFPKKTEKIKAALTSTTLKAKLCTAESELAMNTSSSTIESTTVATSITNSEKEKKPPTTASKAPPTPHHREEVRASVPKTTEKHKSISTVSTADHSHPHQSHGLGSTSSSTNSASSAHKEQHHHFAREPSFVATTPAVPASVASISAFRQSIRRKSMVANPFESITSLHSSSLDVDDDDDKSNPSPHGGNGSNNSSPAKVNHAASSSPAKKANSGFPPLDSPNKKSSTVILQPATASTAPSSTVMTNSPIQIVSDYQLARPDSSLSLNSVNLNTNLPKNITMNMMVRISRGKEVSANGIVRFIGRTSFAAGVWIGVELFSDTGKNNGTVQGQSYFECPANRGLFVKEENVEPLSSLETEKIMEKPTNSSTISINTNSSVVREGNAGSPKKNSGENIGDEIRDALLSTSSFIKCSPTTSLPFPSPVMVQGHISQVNESNGLEKRHQLKTVLKLKVSQLLETLNGQMDIVKQLEEEEKVSSPFNGERYRSIIDEIADLTTQELELIHSFKSSLVTQQLY